MARRRNSKGQFVRGGGGGGKRRGRRRGMGSIITVRRGMGALDLEGMLPALIGGGLAALTALGIRWFIVPEAGMKANAVKWAPAVGTLVGAVGALGLYFMGGANAASQAFLSSAIVGAFGLGSDMVLKEKGPTLLAVIVASAPAANGAEAPAGAAGFGAIVPEYSSPGMGAIAMESVGAGGRRAGTIGSYGETVSLSGVNTGAFGTPGFQA